MAADGLRDKVPSTDFYPMPWSARPRTLPPTLNSSPWNWAGRPSAPVAAALPQALGTAGTGRPGNGAATAGGSSPHFGRKPRSRRQYSRSQERRRGPSASPHGAQHGLRMLVSEHLASGSGCPEIVLQHMDVPRLPDPCHQRGFTDRFGRRCPSRRFDLNTATDDAAVFLLARSQPSPFAGTPVCRRTCRSGSRTITTRARACRARRSPRRLQR